MSAIRSAKAISKSASEAELLSTTVPPELMIHGMRFDALPAAVVTLTL
jgi:hypothetical protein